MRKNKKTEATINQMKVQSLLFLCGALIFFILGLASTTYSEYFPYVQTSLLSGAAKQLSSNDRANPMSIDEILIGNGKDTANNDQGELEFSKEDNKIFLSAKIKNPLAKKLVSCNFYYLGSEENSKPFLVSNETVVIESFSGSEQIVTFTLSSPGSQWQLEGNFKAIISLPDSDSKAEMDFKIL